MSQYRLAQQLQLAPSRLSEYEWGRRMPSWFVLVRYAKLAGIPLEFIVDDETDLEYFKYYLTLVEEKRRQLAQQQEPTEQRIVLYFHGPKP